MFGLSGRQIFILLLLAAMIYAVMQYFPPYYTSFQFNDYIRQEVKYAITARRTPITVRDRIVSKAEELGIDVSERDIKITRRGPSFQLELEYAFPIDLLVYQHDLVFHSNESGEVFDDPRERFR
jgi:hypothetical protein